MNHKLIAAIYCASLVAACTSTQLTTAQTDIATGVAAACTDATAAAKLNPTSPVAVYITAACPLGEAAATLVQNSATIEWLGQVEAQVAAPTAAASAPAASTAATAP